MTSSALLALACATLAPGWRPAEFPISYWYGPDTNDRGTWQRVKDCGFTVAGMRGYGREGNLAMLDHCQAVGLRAILQDSRLHRDITANPQWAQAVAALVAEVQAHPALYGYYLTDEPNSQWFAPLGQIVAELQRLDPTHLAYINLFPTYASQEQLGTRSYREHLAAYLELVQPAVLSYDHYALLDSGEDRADYYENLALVREAALARGIPPWYILLSLPHPPYRDPSAAELRWQVYTALAYGMQGLMYFTYATPPGLGRAADVGLVDTQGQPTRLYGLAQTVNREVLALGPTLLALRSRGVAHYGAVPPGAAALGRDWPLQLSGPGHLVVGLLEDAQGVEHILLANASHREPFSGAATLRADLAQVAEVSRRDGQPLERVVTDGRLPLELAAGDGLLLRLTSRFVRPQPPRPSPQINFEFNQPGNLLGWSMPNDLTDLQVDPAGLHAVLSGSDPFLCRTYLRVPADQYGAIVVRMKVTGGSTAGQFFWATWDEPTFADDKYLNFPIRADGEWHEYRLPVGEHPKWAGRGIAAIRLDPVAGGAPPGATWSLAWVKGE
ncbi:MAG: hypothetical protein IT204_05305 [Fimbriimonadaceae bacterium]|nr:hypothetical protein [Fimbriimonadaceae bacterium]